MQLSATDIFGPQAQTWDAKQNSEMSPPFFDFGTSSAGSSTAQKITAILLLIPQWKGVESLSELIFLQLKCRKKHLLVDMLHMTFQPGLLSMSVCTRDTSCEPILLLICIILSPYYYPNQGDYNGNMSELKYWEADVLCPFWERNTSLTWHVWMFLAACVSCWHFKPSR